MTVFIDTNVLLDVLAKREPFYADAARIWALAEQGRIAACISAISFNNVYYIIRRAAGKAKAEEALVALRTVFSPIELTVQVLHQAMDARMDDFEDAIQLYSAVRAEAVCLVSRNPGDFPMDATPIVSPAEFLATMLR